MRAGGEAFGYLAASVKSAARQGATKPIGPKPRRSTVELHGQDHSHPRRESNPQPPREQRRSFIFSLAARETCASGERQATKNRQGPEFAEKRRNLTSSRLTRRALFYDDRASRDKDVTTFWLLRARPEFPVQTKVGGSNAIGQPRDAPRNEAPGRPATRSGWAKSWSQTRRRSPICQPWDAQRNNETLGRTAPRGKEVTTRLALAGLDVANQHPPKERPRQPRGAATSPILRHYNTDTWRMASSCASPPRAICAMKFSAPLSHPYR